VAGPLVAGADTGHPVARNRRTLWLLLVSVMCAAVTAGCGVSTGDAQTRDTKVVAQALSEADSAAQAALLAVQTPPASITSPYQRQVVADAEKGFQSGVSTFEGRQPPNTAASNALDARSGAVLDRAGDDLRALRIAVERGDQGEIAKARTALTSSAKSLAEADDELSSS
jgi:hypothetical protein